MTRPTRCSISRGLPRFDAIRAEHVAPAVDDAARATRAPPSSASSTDPRAPTWDDGRRAARRRARPARSRVGRRAPSQRGRQHAGDARRLPRQPAEDHGVLHRPRPGRAAVRALPRARRVARVRVARCGEAPRRRRTSCATSGWAAPSCPTPGRRASRRSRKSSRRCRRAFDDNLLDATNAWALYVDDAARARRRAGRRGRRSARGRAGRRHATAGSSRCACPATCR